MFAFSLASAMGIILLWVFLAPKSYLKFGLFLGSLMMIVIPIAVHLGLEKAQVGLADDLHHLAVVSGATFGFLIVITSQLTLWASRNGVGNSVVSGEEISQPTHQKIFIALIVVGALVLTFLPFLPSSSSSSSSSKSSSSSSSSPSSNSSSSSGKTMVDINKVDKAVEECCKEMENRWDESGQTCYSWSETDREKFVACAKRKIKGTHHQFYSNGPIVELDIAKTYFRTGLAPPVHF
jgi:hypothetical protein